jgi:polyisoprenyl-phosphate glycosyltransferase
MPHVEPAIQRHQDAGDRPLLGMEDGVERDEPSLRADPLAGCSKDSFRDRRAEVMEHAERDDDVEGPDVERVEVDEIGIDVRRTSSDGTLSSCAADVVDVAVHADVLDVTEVVDEVAVAASEVEDPRSGGRPYVVAHDDPDAAVRAQHTTEQRISPGPPEERRAQGTPIDHGAPTYGVGDRKIRTMAPADTSTDLAVVVPVYGCAGCLVALHERLVRVLDDLGISFELIFVDDRATDDSWSILRDLADRDERVRAIRLSRNFGQQAAITAGLAACRSRWTVVMDCDLQDPPEMIPRLWAKAQEGFDVVLGRRRTRKHSVFRRLAAKAYFHFLKTVVGGEAHGDISTFSLISARVRDAVLTFPDQDRQYVPMLLWTGFEQTAVSYDGDPRFDGGKSSYTLGTLMRVAVAGVLFQTTTLLRWIIYLGLFVASAGFLLACYLVAAYFFISPPPGWTSLVVTMLITTGVLTISTGVTGLYVGNVFREVKGRPLYLVDVEYQRERQPSSHDVEATEPSAPQ